MQRKRWTCLHWGKMTRMNMPRLLPVYPFVRCHSCVSNISIGVNPVVGSFFQEPVHGFVAGPCCCQRCARPPSPFPSVLMPILRDKDRLQDSDTGQPNGHLSSNGKPWRHSLVLAVVHYLTSSSILHPLLLVYKAYYILQLDATKWVSSVSISWVTP